MVTSQEYLGTMDGADPTGCARLIDGALRPGPSSWLRRVPIAEPLQFHHETDYATALALDLLVRRASS